VVANSTSYKLPYSLFFKLSIEELSINHLIPAGGVAGHTLVVRAIHRRGLPVWLGMEMVLVSLLGFYIAYSSVSAIAVTILWLHHGITPVVSSIVSAFFLIILFLTTVILLFLFKKIINLPKWLGRIKIVSTLTNAISSVSRERVLSGKLLIQASVLRALIFLCDTMILWLMMRAISTPVAITTAFIALVIGSIASSVTFWPGGFVSFDAACVTMLILFKVPAEAAIAGTLLLRGISLWIPLIPGFLLARKEIAPISK
jgi:uncharacterized membrane protein YbhN (UPF0104 family)